MITMKRFTLSVTVAAVLGLAAFTIAGAQAPGGGPVFERGGFGRGMMPALRGVDLTDDQKERIREIRQAEREADQAPPADLQLHRQLQTEIFADVPDTVKLATLQDQIAQAQAARLAKRVEIEQRIAQVLTAEQRATIRENLAKAPEGRGPGVRRGMRSGPQRGPAQGVR
jgi:protein CpxP